MKNNNLIAALESKIDHLETELSYLDTLLINCGFPEGIKTLKQSAEELINETAAAYKENT
jgi:hypothetical protein